VLFEHDDSAKCCLNTMTVRSVVWTRCLRTVVLFYRTSTMLTCSQIRVDESVNTYAHTVREHSDW